MAEIVVGTSGFSYEDWVGPVYPQRTAKKDFLGIYASEFSLVELNFSYYRQPEPWVLERMLNNTPESFQFAIKAHQSLTHVVDENFAQNLSTYKERIAPLIDSSRLAAVLFQFPYSFHYTPPSRKHLKTICSAFADLPAAVEFRNNEWLKESVYKGLKEYNMALVNVDEPQLPKLPRPGHTVTADLSYVRFHGRNKKEWWTGDNISRYDYLYSREELEGWLPLIRVIAKQVKLLLITFNNHRRGQAVQNARQMKQLLLLEEQSQP
ncbi:hypothetical protein ES703_34244 [subsurface metagenome]